MKHYTPEVRVVRAATRLCLAGLALFALGRAMAYNPLVPTRLRERLPVSVSLLVEGGLPLAALSTGWILAFLVLIVGIIRPRIWTTLPLVAMTGLWTVAHVASWSLTPDGNGYIYVLTYAAFVLIIVGGGYLAGRALALAVRHDQGAPQ